MIKDRSSRRAVIVGTILRFASVAGCASLLLAGAPAIADVAIEGGSTTSVLRPAMPALQRCYREFLTGHPGVAGHLEARLTIARDGSVRDVSIQTEALRSMVPCVETVLRGLRFRETSAETTRVVPLEFHP